MLTTTVTGLPTDGSTVYVTLYSLVGGNWIANSYTYTAFTSTGALGVMQTPTTGSTLNGNQADLHLERRLRGNRVLAGYRERSRRQPVLSVWKPGQRADHDDV